MLYSIFHFSFFIEDNIYINPHNINMKFSEGVIAFAILAIILLFYYSSPSSMYAADVCVLTGFTSLEESDRYFRDPYVGNETRMLRVITYSLMPRPCMTNCAQIMDEARGILSKIYKNRIASDVLSLEQYLLLVWNDCIPESQYPANLMLNLKLFRSFRDRMPPPYVNSSLNELRTMLYVNNSFSPFFLDCDRLTLSDLNINEAGACGESNCRIDCTTEPNFSPSTWRRDKFSTMEEAEAYINDPGISEECRLVRAALLVPITTINQYVTDNQAKLLVEEALLCKATNAEQSVYTTARRTQYNDPTLGQATIGQAIPLEEQNRTLYSVSDLESYVMGIARNAGWDYDLTTIKKLMYTTELGNPSRASSIENMFFLAKKIPMFKDAPEVRAPHEAWMPANVISNSNGNLLYQNSSGQIHYPNDYDDAGNPVYVDTEGRVHYLWSPYTNSTAGKAIYTNSTGRAQYPNMINSNGYPYHLNSDGNRHYMASNANDMWGKNITVPGFVHDNLGVLINKHNGERFSAVKSSI